MFISHLQYASCHLILFLSNRQARSMEPISPFQGIRWVNSDVVWLIETTIYSLNQFTNNRLSKSRLNLHNAVLKRDKWNTGFHDNSCLLNTMEEAIFVTLKLLIFLLLEF